jgi:para-nitrobenzyl esterase
MINTRASIKMGMHVLWLLVLLFVYTCKKSTPDTKKAFAGQLNSVRYIDDVFAAADTTYFNVVYRIGKTFRGADTALKMDIYQPLGDTIGRRPVIIFIHGGAFYAGSEKDSNAKFLCASFAKKGYVTASIGYRLGIAWRPGISKADSINLQLEAVYRANQDARAAIRYIKKYSAFGRLDTTRIFVVGGSAGAATAINVAYLENNELSADFLVRNGPVDLQGIGGFDYSGFSAKVKGIVNIEGFIYDSSWIDTGDIPIFSFYGTSDPFYRFFDVEQGSPNTPFFGGQSIQLRVKNLGILNGIKTYPGGVHGSSNNPQNADTTLKYITNAIFSQL